MTVLIAKDNEWFFADIMPTIIFNESTKNTSTFKCSNSEFDLIKTELKNKGMNPYALMSW